MARPRSEEARQAILAAAVALTTDHGYGRLTMEAIARRAGVSKQTVYRWWPAKAPIVLEALNEAAATVAPAPDTGSLETDLRTFLRRTVAGATGANRRLLAALMAEAQLDDEFAASFRSGFLARRRAVLREILVRGGADGDVDHLVEIVFAMLWYRILGGHAALSRAFADTLTETVLALAARPPRSPRAAAWSGAS